MTFGALTLLLLAPAALAAPVPATPDDAIVALPEFQVSGDDDRGYDAALSTTASRVAEKNQNLPYNVNVVTADFMRDFAVMEHNEAFAFSSSFGGNNSATLGGYTLRGVAAAGLVDGFRGGGLVDFGNIARAEIIKGPAAAIYGQAEPGGLFNLVTAGPSSRRQESIRFDAGNYGQQRAEIAATGPLGAATSHAAYRVFAADTQRSFEQAFSERHTSTAALAVARKFSDDTSLLARLDYTDRQDNGIRGPVPFLVTPANVNLRTGFATELIDFNQAGPNTWFSRRQVQGALTGEHRFNPVLSLRLGGFFYTRLNHDLEVAADRFNPATRQIIVRTPQYISQRIDGRSGQADLLAAGHWHDLALRTLFTYDYAYTHSRVQAFQLTAADNLLATRNVRNLSVDAPNWFVLPYSARDYPVVSSDRFQNTEVQGLFLRQQVAAFHGRLIALAAVRRDDVTIAFTDRVNRVQQEGSVSNLTSQFGLNFKITDTVVGYASRAGSFLPQTGGTGQLVSTDEVGNPLANEKGLGYEGGLKAEALGGRLSGTLAFYRIERNNVRDTELVDLPNGTTVTRTRTTGQYRSEGVEFDGNWKLTSALQVLGGVGFADPRITKNGTDVDSIGRRAARAPRQVGGVALRYAFTSGPLNHLSLTLGVTYTGDTFPFSAQTSTDTNHNGLIDRGEGDSRRDLKLPGYTIWQAGAAYEWVTGRGGHRRLNHRVQFNVKNLFDRRYLDNGAYAADRLNVVGSYGLKF